MQNVVFIAFHLSGTSLHTLTLLVVMRVFYPLLRYVSQLYHKVTRIKWEHDTPAHLLKGGRLLVTQTLPDYIYIEGV